MRLYTHTHTHTHTHTDALFNGKKKGIVVVCLIAIAFVCVLFFVNKNVIMRNSIMRGLNFRNKIGEGGELENSDAFFSTSNVGGASQVDTSNWDLDRVNIVYDTEGVPVPVPKGFTASGADGEHTVNTGFVIYEGDGEVNNDNAWDESCNRNQFVWVPVYDPSRVYEEIGTTGKKKAKLWNFTSTGRTEATNTDEDTKREPGIYGERKQDFIRFEMQGYTKDELNKDLEYLFDNTIESIKKYGGFYFGRYETGNISFNQPVVHRMNTDIGSQTWYTMYLKMKSISSNENVETSMVWGCLWDETLQWFIDVGAKTQEEVALDSGSWGNYVNTTFTYTDISGVTKTKVKKYEALIPTGSSEHNAGNNIYDMAGNVRDWTLQGGRTDFGGVYYGNSTFSASQSYGSNPEICGEHIGSRAFMYIK